MQQFSNQFKWFGTFFVFAKHKKKQKEKERNSKLLQGLANAS